MKRKLSVFLILLMVISSVVTAFAASTTLTKSAERDYYLEGDLVIFSMRIENQGDETNTYYYIDDIFTGDLTLESTGDFANITMYRAPLNSTIIDASPLEEGTDYLFVEGKIILRWVDGTGDPAIVGKPPFQKVVPFFPGHGDKTLTLGPGEFAYMELHYVVQEDDPDELQNQINSWGEDSNGDLLDANVTTSITVIHPSIEIVKSVDFDGDGIYTQMEYGYLDTAAEWEIVVTNTGDDPVEVTALFDDHGWTEAAPFMMAPGEVRTYYHSTTIGTTTLNTAEVYAEDRLGNPLSDEDDAEAIPFNPDIEIVKSVDFDGDGIYTQMEYGYLGADAEWEIVVTNTGDDPVEVTALFDDHGWTEAAPFMMAPGEVRTYYHTSAIDAPTLNTAEVVAVDRFGNPLSDEDDAEAIPFAPSIEIIKSVDFDGDGIYTQMEYGILNEPADWEIVVTNTGDDDVTVTALFDDHGWSETVPFVMVPGEVRTYYHATPIGAPTLNIAEVEAEDRFGNPLYDSDDAEAIPLSPDIEIVKSVDFDGDGIYTQMEYGYLGTDAEWEIVVTNTGDDPIEVTALFDDHGWTEAAPFMMAPGEVRTYYHTSTIDAPTLNTAEVMAVDRFGTPLSDEDDAEAIPIDPSIMIEKTVEFDGDGIFTHSEMGFAGTDATWRIIVTNNGDSPVFDIDVTDTNMGPLGVIPVLNPGDPPVTFEYTETIYAPKSNTATAVGYDELGGMVGPVEDTADVTIMPMECNEETAWGRDPEMNEPFTELEGKLRNWGWTNGPLQPGRYEFELWAAAGQNDLTKGTLAGHVFVDYDGMYITVEYVTMPNFMLHEGHLYIGDLPLPMKKNGYTNAPGQFPYTIEEEANSYLFGPIPVDELGLDQGQSIYVAAHAVVCIPVYPDMPDYPDAPR